MSIGVKQLFVCLTLYPACFFSFGVQVTSRLDGTVVRYSGSLDAVAALNEANKQRVVILQHTSCLLFLFINRLKTQITAYESL